MIKPEQVPKEAADAVWALISKGDFTSTEDAIAAAINAWPGMKYTGPTGGELSQEPLQAPLIILPLPQEKNDD